VIVSAEVSFYQLGRYAFGVKCSDKDMRDFLATVLPPCRTEATSELFVVDLDELMPGKDFAQTVAEGFDPVSYLMNLAFEQHPGYLWMDAAALITDQGKSILLCGCSHSGKSTAALALAFWKPWSVVAEDIVLIDMATDTLVTFASPFSVREGTLQRIEAATGILPGPLLPHARIPAADKACHYEPNAAFDFAFYLDLIDHRQTADLEVEPMAPLNYLHHLLPISNALRLRDGTDKLMHYLGAASCYRLSNGQLCDRLETISGITSGYQQAR
jgi:hypothetical protein